MDALRFRLGQVGGAVGCLGARGQERARGRRPRAAGWDWQPLAQGMDRPQRADVPRFGRVWLAQVQAGTSRVDGASSRKRAAEGSTGPGAGARRPTAGQARAGLVAPPPPPPSRLRVVAQNAPEVGARDRVALPAGRQQLEKRGVPVAAVLLQVRVGLGYGFGLASIKGVEPRGLKAGAARGRGGLLAGGARLGSPHKARRGAPRHWRQPKASVSPAEAGTGLGAANY